MSVASAILARSPSSYWKLDEASGNTVDSVGAVTGTYAFSPTQNQPPVTPGDASGKSVLFSNALGSSLDFGNVYDFTGNAAFTALAWLKPGTYNNATGHVIWSNYDSGAKGWGLDIIAPAVTWRMFRGDNAGFDIATYQITQAEYEDGIVKMIALVYDGTDLVLNINGIEVKRQASAKVMTAPSVNTFLRFGGYGGNGSYYGGYADDLAMFSSALTAAQLLGIYQAAVQALVPDADTTTTGWTTTPLWSKLDEAVAGGDVVTATAA